MQCSKSLIRKKWLLSDYSEQLGIGITIQNIRTKCKSIFVYHSQSSHFIRVVWCFKRDAWIQVEAA